MNKFAGHWLNALGTKLIGVAVFSVFLLLATVVVITGPQAEPAPKVEKSWPVSVISAMPHSIPPVLMSYGKLESRQFANLKTSLNAPVQSIVKAEGEWVNRGDLILQLDAAEVSLALQIAQANYQRSQAQLASVQAERDLANELTQHHRDLADYAQSNLRRFQELHSSSMISDADLDLARQQASERAMVLASHLSALADFPNRIEQQMAAVREANARMQQAELDLQQASVVAPFSGRVLSIHVAEGDRAIPGSTLVEVADYEQLEVRASVSAELGVRMRYALQKNKTIKAKAQLGSREVEFELDRLSGNIKEGQSGLDAFFNTPLNEALVIGSVINLVVSLPVEHEVIALPMHSLYENNRIYRVENNRLASIEVTRVGDYIDEQGNYRVLVRSDALQPGDSVMTTQLPTAISGLLVTPVAFLQDQADA